VRVVYLGNDPWSVPPLEALAADPRVDLALVLTRTPRPGRRGGGPVPTSVATAARERGVAVGEVATVRDGEGRAALLEARADVLAVVAYGEILPVEILRAAPLGAVNLHLSLLPRWRGASPVQHALLAGDAETGVTTMLLDEGLDTGPVLARRSTPITPEDDAGELGARLARMGGELLLRTLMDLAEGRATPHPQDGSLATYAPKLTARDRRLSWDVPADEVVRRVREFSPHPAADTLRGGRVLKISEASVDRRSTEAEPGTIVAVDRSSFDVAAGMDVVRVHEVASEGRARLDAGAWLRGARLEPGERLG
jgi:methionyl-tRNA formyltransferase